MGILIKLSQASRAKAATEASTALTAMSPELIRWLGNPTASGKSVTEDGALRIGAAWSCIRILTETLGALPWAIYRRDDQGNAERADDHPLNAVLVGSPNAEQTSLEFREVLTANLCANGNAYALKDKSAGRLVSLYPMRSSDVKPMRKQGGNTRLALAEGEVFFRHDERGKPEDLPRDKVWHVKGFGLDPLLGLSPVGAAREAMGVALATEEFAARFFSQGGMPGGIVTIEKWLEPDQREKARALLQHLVGGLGRAHQFALLEGGMKAEPWDTMPLEDMQFLLLRKFSVEEICRFYRIPPHMVAHLDRATFSNIEHLSQEFVMFTLMPYFTRIEASAAKWLMSVEDRARYFLRFNAEGLLRAASEGRAEFYASALQNGWMNRNEVRGKENLNRVDGLDEYTVQSNMALLEQLAAMVAAKNPPPPPAKEGDVLVYNLMPPAPEIKIRQPDVHVRTGNVEVRPPDVTVNTGAVEAPKVDVQLPGRVEYSVAHTHEHALPEIEALAARVAEVAELARTGAEGHRDLIKAVSDVAAEIRKPRKAVLDAAGEPIGTVAVDQLDAA